MAEIYRLEDDIDIDDIDGPVDENHPKKKKDKDGVEIIDPEDDDANKDIDEGDDGEDDGGDEDDDDDDDPEENM